MMIGKASMTIVSVCSPSEKVNINNPDVISSYLELGDGGGQRSRDECAVESTGDAHSH